MTILRTTATALAVSLLLCVSGLSLGCFVFDELNKSEEQMKNPSFGPAPKKSSAPAPSKAPAAGPSGSGSAAISAVKKQLDAWWGKARTLTSEEVDDDLVRCELPGGTRFMNRNGCLHEGGVPGAARG